jgi:hypothetical protein
MPKVRRTIVYEYVCNDCGDSIMEYEYETKYNNYYKHICNDCGYTVYLPYVYPKLENNSLEKVLREYKNGNS